MGCSSYPLWHEYRIQNVYCVKLNLFSTYVNKMSIFEKIFVTKSFKVLSLHRL